MLRETGVKLNLSSGMASAAPTNSLSRMLTCWSTADAIVGGAVFFAWALGVAAGLAACANMLMAKHASASKQKILRCFMCFSSSLIYELVRSCKRYHGDKSKPAVRAIAAKVSVNCTPALEATAPQTALPRASPPCRTSTYIEITRARTQAGAAVCAARLSVARMPIHASPAAAEKIDDTASEWDHTNPQSATAKIRVAKAITASGDNRRRARDRTPAPPRAPRPKKASIAPKP